ncbi:MAG: hypothetical protein E3J50_02740, partial [Dehalococcoidia bacterium]
MGRAEYVVLERKSGGYAMGDICAALRPTLASATGTQNDCLVAPLFDKDLHYFPIAACHIHF